MMTASFDEFMRQYEMTGSEKADGYSRNVFVGLDPQEAESVFHILLREIPYSTKWLFFLDAEKALPIIKEMEKAWRGDPYKGVFMLQAKLLEYTGDLTYQARMIEDYPHYVDYLKAHVVSAIGNTPANAATINFMQQVVISETDGDAVARAARALLETSNITSKTDAEKCIYNGLQRELRSDDVHVRRGALAKIDLFAAGDLQAGGR